MHSVFKEKYCYRYSGSSFVYDFPELCVPYLDEIAHLLCGSIFSYGYNRLFNTKTINIKFMPDLYFF